MVESKDYPVCPYCGDKYEDVYELLEGKNVIKCDGCGKNYVCDVMSFTYEEGGESEEENEYTTEELPVQNR